MSTALEEPATFTMPQIETGDTVLFWQDPSCITGGSGAIVTSAGSQNINVTVFTDRENGFRKTGVRHKDDPILKLNPNLRQMGCWDYSPQYKRSLSLMKLLGSEKGLEDLIRKIANDTVLTALTDPKAKK